MQFKAIKIKNFFKRKATYKKEKGLIYLANGENNDYPTLVELLVNNSHTARACAGVIADFMFGKGFSFERQAREQAKAEGKRFDTSQFHINDYRETPNILLKKVAENLAVHRGCFLHINYNMLYQKTSVQVLPYAYCRLGAKDHKNYKGKVLVYDNWDKQAGKEAQKQAIVIDLYDPRPEVIQAQIDKAEGIENYKGQVYFLNFDRNDSYPLAWADVCLLDCESERLSSVFINKGFKRGFFGKWIAITRPFESDNERDEFREQLQLGTGADSEETMWHFETDLNSEELEKSFKLEPLESNINDKSFEYSDKRTANIIRKAYGNIPPVLIDYIEGKLGNTSGESLLQAKQFMQDQTERERQDIQEAFEEIFFNFEKNITQNGVFEIEKIVN